MSDNTDENKDISMHRYKVIKIIDISEESDTNKLIDVWLQTQRSFIGPHIKDNRRVNFGLFLGD